MGFSYESEFIFIGKGDESFLENYSYELNDDPEGKGGKIYMALEILNNQAEAEDIGEAIFANFKQKFYDAASNADPFVRFEEALKAANVTVETLKEEKVSRFIGNLNISIGAIVDNTLYISSTGDSEAYLIRKKFVSVVSEGLAGDSSTETFVNIANGNLENGDRVIFSSSRLLRYITKGELGKIFSDMQFSNIGDALTELQEFIMTEILGRGAVIGVAISEKIEDDVPGEELFDREGGEINESVYSSVGSFLGKIPKPKLSLLSGIFDKAKEILGKAKVVEQEKSAPPKIHFHEKMPRERLLMIVAVLLIALVSGTFWVRNQSDQRQRIAEQQAKLSNARELLNESATVGQFDKSKASEILVSAEKLVVEVLNSRFLVLRADAVKTLDEIKKNRENLDEVKHISNPSILVDFSEKRSTVNALGLMALKDRLFGFEYNALYEIVLDKIQEPLTISDTETVILGTEFVDKNALLFLTSTGKVIQYSDGRFSSVSTKDGIWKKGKDMKMYNGRMYILDPERNQIWRYQQVRDGFDVGTPYNQNAELKDGISLAIDSNVYVLNKDGYIVQLYQGQKQEYPLRRPPLDPIVAPTKIYTSTDLGYLYILEPSKKRVVLLRKDPKNGGAQYQTQYVFDQTGILRDMLVSDNRLYVMDDKKVYYVNLSGL